MALRSHNYLESFPFTMKQGSLICEDGWVILDRFSMPEKKEETKENFHHLDTKIKMAI